MDILHNNAKGTMLRAPANTVGTVTTAYVDMSDYERVRFVALIGNIPSSCTVDIQVLQATSSAGAGAKTITGGSITQLADSDDNKAVSLDIHAAALDLANSFEFVALKVMAPDTIVAGAWADQYHARHGTITQGTNYTQQVAVY